MSEQNEDSATRSEHEHHIVSPMVYLVILFVAAGGHRAHGLGVVHRPGPLESGHRAGHRCAKAMLVVLFFMHVKYSTKLTKLTVICGIFIFLALISMTLADYMSRAWGRW